MAAVTVKFSRGFVLAALLCSTPATSFAITIPCGMVLVGSTAGVPDPAGRFTIQTGIPASHVSIDFVNCRDGGGQSDLRLCKVQPSGGTVVCFQTPGRVDAVANGVGDVTLTLVGGGPSTASGSTDPGYASKPPCVGGVGCATVTINGVTSGNMSVALLDANGAGGVNVADISVVLSDLLAYPGKYVARSDFNFSGTLNPADLSLMVGVVFSGTSFSSCAGIDYCQ